MDIEMRKPTLKGLNERLNKHAARIAALEARARETVPKEPPAKAPASPKPLSNTQDLIAALQSANGGEVFAIGGIEGPLALSGINPASRVTITGGTLSGLNLRNCSNLNFDNIHFNYTVGTGAFYYDAPFALNTCTAIEITDSQFHGDNAKESVGTSDTKRDYPCGTGLTLMACRDIKILRNTFRTFFRGIEHHMCDRLAIEDNIFEDILSDAITNAQVQGIRIVKNRFVNFRKKLVAFGTHCDCIQFWTTDASRPSTDILIEGNYLDPSEDEVQGIFMRNEAVDRDGKNLEAMAYRNVKIVDNHVHNTHAHGITLGESIGVVVSGNKVHPLGDKSTWRKGDILRPKITVAKTSRDVSITTNTGQVVPDVWGEKFPEAWTVSGNEPVYGMV
jgi:hypothetical protein